MIQRGKITKEEYGQKMKEIKNQRKDIKNLKRKSKVMVEVILNYSLNCLGP